MSISYRLSRALSSTTAVIVVLVTMIAFGTHLQPVSAGSPQGTIVISPNTSTTQTNSLNGVSCTSATACTAVGYYVGSSTAATPTTTYSCPSGGTLSGSTCYVTSTSSYAASYSSGYYYCPSGGSLSGSTCYVTTTSSYPATATTTYSCPSGGTLSGSSCSYNQTLIEQWNGTSWSIVPSPNTSTTQTNYLYGVSCTSATACMAVGYYSTGTYDQTLIEQWNGTSWSIVTSPNTSTTQKNWLQGVSCTSATACMAVGSYNTGSYNQTLIEQWNGTSWSIVTSPNASTTQDNTLFGVSCTSASSCTAVGAYNSGTYNQTLIEQWNGTSWSIVTSPNTSTTLSNDLYGVSCTSTTFCMAAGFYFTGSYWQTLIEQWNGTTWSIVTSPNTSTTLSNDLYGVSCTSTTACMAVGFNSNAGVYQTLIEEFTMVCSGGPLTLTAPTSITFPPLTLNGLAQTSAATTSLSPDDETGLGSGWNIQVTSTTFTSTTNSSYTLPTNASTVTGVSSLTNPTGNCIPPTNTILYSPAITVPTGSTAPTAAPIFSANTSTGEGPSTVSLTFQLAIPAGALPGTYNSTWTFSIASGP